MNRREFILAACGGAAAVTALGKASGATGLRIVQILVRDVEGVGSWRTVRMKELRKGDVFRMFNSPGEAVVDSDGNKIWVATEDAHQGCAGAPDEGVWGVSSKPPGFPIVMNPGKRYVEGDAKV